MSVGPLIASAISATHLRILVFGPSPTTSAPPGSLLDGLRTKRAEIRAELLNQGHTADFPEDLVDSSAPPPFDNPWFQEQLLMKSYDLILVLIGSPGSTVELGAISTNPTLCRKSQLFLCADHVGGLADQACKLAANLDARVMYYTFPPDIVDCHLFGAIDSIVKKLQVAKTLLL